MSGNCTVQGCPRQAHCRGYCQMHYNRVRRNGAPGPALPKTVRYETNTCAADGCDRDRRGGAWCGMHANRIARHGDPAIRLSMGPEPRTRRYPDDLLTYAAAHQRLAYDRGPARDHACVCGAPAAQWALMWERAQHLLTVNGRTFSGNTDDYDPMCVSCHRRMDLARIAASRRGGAA